MFLDGYWLWQISVIIKTIELLHYLKNENLIPEKDILLLMPRDFLIEQFQEQIDDYNN